MNLDKLTVKSQELVQSAHEMAQKYGNQAIEPVHFLKVMLEDDQGIILSILKKIGIQTDVLNKDIHISLELIIT